MRYRADTASKRELNIRLIVRFWGWTENEREQEMDRQEMTERARQGLPLYGTSNEPEWVQGAAHRNSVFSQLKFRESDACQFFA